MKRLAFLLAPVVLLSGCAQIFSGNMFQSIDKPSPPDTSSVAALESAAASDPKFYTEFAGDPTGLAAAQTTLATGFSTAAITAAGTTATAQAAVITAAQTYILTTAFSTNVSSVTTNAINQLSNLKSGSGSDTTAAVQALFTGQSAAQIQATLDQYVNISTALTAMQTTAAAGGTTINNDLFLGTTTAGTSANGNFVQTALVAGAVAALVADNGSTAALAAALANGTSITTGTNLTDLTNAMNASSSSVPQVTGGSANPYAYMYTLKTSLTSS